MNADKALMLVETHLCIASNTKHRCCLLSSKGKVLNKYYVFMIYYYKEIKINILKDF